MSPFESASGPGPFGPGYVFAGRYRMVNRIGRGERGEVWRADDLVLQTPVALKLIETASRRARERILTEVRLARQITHPAVCRIFDVGESADRVFYSMELVQGQDLATLLRRAGRLPPEKVLDIGQQLCGGLAAAHAHGVLHRNLKPANVLIDEDGSVRMTDTGFGVARDDTGYGAQLGTSDYLAPEQLVPGQPVSDTTDLYALGAILYELLVGERPFRGQSNRSAHPARPSTLVEGVDPRLDRVILQALAARPHDRPASATAMAESLQLSPAARRARVRGWLVGAGVVSIVGVLAVLSSFFLRHAARPLTDQDTIVLAELTNSTGESVFDGTLKIALAVALEQSPFLKVFPDDRVLDTLRLMQRSPDERVTRSLAREIARREQLKALVAGSIGSLGSHYAIALEAVNAETGDVMAREQVEAASKEEVITSLGVATSRLREKLGESLGSIQKFDVPLPRATTASLAALHAYSVAFGQGRTVPGVEAIPHLKRALELDPDFAMAQALLSGVYANANRSAEAPVFSRRAFELRGRVSERERFFLSWRYYIDAAQAWDEALNLARSWTATYPREAFAFNSLGLASAAFGQHEEAVRAFREAIRIDSKFVPPHRNLTGSLIALNRFDEARSVLREATAAGIESLGLRQLGYLLAFLANESPAMIPELARPRSPQEAMWSLNSEAQMSRFSGQLRAAHDLFQRSAQAALRENFQELGGGWMVEDAETHAIAGQCVDARREAAAGLELGRDNFTLERASRTLALCDASAEASTLSAELANRFGNATLTTRIQLPVTAAALAVRRGEPARALALLDPLKPYDHAPAAEFWPAYLRGDAYLQLKDGRSAAMQFQSILDHRGEAPTSPLYPLARLGLARAAALTGDVDQARKAYDGFLVFWHAGDSSLPPLTQAREEYARLR